MVYRDAFVSYAIVTGKSSSPDKGVLVAQGDLNESIKEEYMSWEDHLQLALQQTFTVRMKHFLILVKAFLKIIIFT